MARKANRGCGGGKKNTTLLMKEALVDLDEASRFSDCEVDLSTKEVMVAEDMPSLRQVGQDGSIEDVSVKEPIVDNGVLVGCLDEDPVKVDQKVFVQDWRSLF